MKPSVGRIVHYYTLGGAFSGKPIAATITETATENPYRSPMDVGIFGMHHEASIQLESVSYSEKPKPGCWSWPPRVA